MTYAYFLAGENLRLAEKELEGFLRSRGLPEKVEKKGRIALAPRAMKGRLRRLALVQEVSELIEKGDAGELDIDYRPDESFEVRVKDAGDTGIGTKVLQEKIGSKLEASGNRVDLEDPEEKIRVYFAGEEYFLCRLVEDINRGLYGERRNQERPFSSPVSLDPVLARVLVNLSGVSPGEHVLDPFCGTGGILIEAGLCGVGVHGLDAQQKMVEGTEKNLEEYGIINHDIRKARVEESTDELEKEFDAVITDLPYGEASKVEGTPVETFLEEAGKLSDTVVFMSDREKLAGMEPEHEIYVHSSLTRYIYIMQS